ncbi:threonine/homoserine/homoserine lactone efflux protein [Streptomyces olivoverticillatus]|uniref:Threonine/homoserine/homoserine lactone efflux protein n=1 Tax=Streptomyces olivoverticillatus TaxID=66427 RepID=A0A7W7LMF8_9ACTN|nr:LysE family translocator [Streptomyces olivoverticillatus]MBB4892945.1 threonine/homoserine/homoserine lactone efflux protein [Streptomyces olivoverticillatus]
MVSTESILAFAAVSLLVIVIPGPSVLFVIGRALAHGRRAALATVLGNLVGSYVLVIAVAWGLGALVESSAAVFTGVKLAGAAYLVHLGVQAFRHRKEMRAADMGAPVGERRGDLRTIVDGVFVGVTNPKGLVFFAAVLPQFVDHSAGRVPFQMMVLGLVPVAIGLITDTLWGLGASAARSWFARSPRRLSMIGGAGGFAMIGLGVTVAATGRAD